MSIMSSNLFKYKSYQCKMNALFIVTLCGCYSNAALAASPSFNCGRATKPDELAICGDQELSMLDVEANHSFQTLRSKIGREAANNLALPLLKQRQLCGSNTICIRNATINSIATYENYINQSSGEAQERRASQEFPAIRSGSPGAANTSNHYNYNNGGSYSWGDSQGVYSTSSSHDSVTYTSESGSIHHFESYPGGSVSITIPPPTVSVGGSHWPSGFGK